MCATAVRQDCVTEVLEEQTGTDTYFRTEDKLLS